MTRGFKMHRAGRGVVGEGIIKLESGTSLR